MGNRTPVSFLVGVEGDVLLVLDKGLFFEAEAGCFPRRRSWASSSRPAEVVLCLPELFDARPSVLAASPFVGPGMVVGGVGSMISS